METFLTKTMTIVALICFLVVGAAATAILGRDSVPAALPQLAAASVAPVQAPVSNKENKKDRLAVVSYALAAYEPPQTTAALSEPLRQAYASTAPVDIGLPKEVAPAAAQAAAEAQGRRQTPAAAAEELRAAERRPDRRNQGPPETVRLPGILLAAGGNRAARRRPQDFTRAGRPTRMLRACRSIPNPQKSSS